MNIAILGYGTVGSGVYDELKKLNNNNLTIKKIWNRPNKDKIIPLYCEDVDEILNDTSIDCIVETIGGIELAHKLIIKALNNKKHVVTANKAVVAAHYAEFIHLAEKNNVAFKFEASVAGGIPWIDNLVKLKEIDSINRIYGILNGTSNYILDQMYKNDLPFAKALNQAQKIGYAEADPSGDVEGGDILNKLIVSSLVAFNGSLSPEDFFVKPMTQVEKADLIYFEKQGYILKYFGDLKYTKNTAEGLILLHAISNNLPDAYVPNNNNILSSVSKYAGTLKFYGQGAGKYPTASSIIRDLNDISNNYYTKENSNYTNFSLIKSQQHKFILKDVIVGDENIIDYIDEKYIYTKAITVEELKKSIVFKEQSLIIKLFSEEEVYD